MKIALYFGALMLLTFILHIGLAPLYKKYEFEKALLEDSTSHRDFQYEFTTPEITSLTRTIAFKDALLNMSQTDSIGLIVNLRDSTLHLSIKGIIIHTTLLRYIQNDPFLEQLPAPLYLHTFSRPLKIVQERSTVIKEPIVIRQAPKDPVEAALNAYQPDTLIQNPAFLEFKLERDISLVIEQDEKPTFTDKWVSFRFHFSGFMNNLTTSLFHFVSFKRQSYTPTIRIKIPTDDLRAIYRALPSNARVVMYYDHASNN